MNEPRHRPLLFAIGVLCLSRVDFKELTKQIRQQASVKEKTVAEQVI